MKQIAICMVTYNRAEVVNDIIFRWLEVVDETAADIFVYDSSTNEDTREIVECIGENKKNVFYINIDSDIHSSKKVYDIYQNRHMQECYKYVWIIPDYFVLSKDVQDKVMEHLNEGYDMLMVDFLDAAFAGDKLYTDKNDIFYHYAWSLTQYGIIILNSETVLKKADWEYLNKKYLVNDTRNFSHVAMYFEVLAANHEIQFYHMSIEQSRMYCSKYRGVSRYLQEYFEIWAKYWPNTINQLPDVYRNKWDAVKRLSQYAGHMNVRNLALLRKEKILTHKIFWQYRKNWKKLSVASEFMFFWSAYAPEEWVEYVGVYGSFWKTLIGIKNKLQLRWFCKKYDKVYIYGAGVVAKRCAAFLEKKNITYEGFLVTVLQNSEKIVCNHLVQGISEVGYQPATGIILAVNEKNKKEILPILYQLGYEKEIYTRM